MQRFFQQSSSWWFATMAPVCTPLTTIDERETLRKRRLFTIILLIGLLGISALILQGFLMRVPAIQQIFDFIGCGNILLSLWINKRGYLKTAALFYFSSMFLLIAAIIYYLSIAIPPLSLIIWVILPLLPVIAGLFLPAWGPILLAIVEMAFMNWFILYGCKNQIALYLRMESNQLQFLAFSCTIISLTGIFSAIYASTTKTAVVQADRAIDLEQAHKTISEAYASLEEAHTTIHKQAYTDELTDLPNHRALMEQLEKELERAHRYEHPFSLLFFDADRFKYVNDTYGHAAGDAVLRQIGIWAESVLRSGDMLGRFGGEEFVALLSEADAQEARRVAERVRVAVAASPVVVAEVAGGISITVSIGFSTYPIDASSEQALLSRADEAMYIAKRLGRNQVRSAEEAQQVAANPELMDQLRQDGQREAAARNGLALQQVQITS